MCERVDKGRIEELREEVGMRESFRRKLVRSQLVGWTHGKNGRGMDDEEGK